MQDNGLIQRLAEEALGKKGAPTYPSIFCRKNVPPDMTCDLHSVGEWEGLKRVLREGRVAYEIDQNFTLIIKPDGSCFIPDTPNNQAKLDRLGKSRVIEETKTRHNSILGVDEEYVIRTTVPAIYERVETNLLSGALVKDLARKVMEESRRMQAEEFAEAEEAEIRPHHAANGTVSREVPAARKGVMIPPAGLPTDPPKRGRAKGAKTDDLLDPIPR